MADIKRELEELFDHMHEQNSLFKRKTYADVFVREYEEHRNIFDMIILQCQQAGESEKADMINGFASVIPDYIERKMMTYSKRVREKHSLDYNMTMVVYIIPMFLYTKNADCEKIAENIITQWNDRKITNMTIGKSDFDSLLQGFKIRLCYITTAVCEGKNKPDDCYELETLREYRDHYLMHTEDGKKLVEEYYDVAPAIVTAIKMQNDAVKIYDRLYEDYVLPCVGLAESGENQKCKELYISMVKYLKSEYLNETGGI